MNDKIEKLNERLVAAREALTAVKAERAAAVADGSAFDQRRVLSAQEDIAGLEDALALATAEQERADLSARLKAGVADAKARKRQYQKALDARATAIGEARTAVAAFVAAIHRVREATEQLAASVSAVHPEDTLTMATKSDNALQALTAGYLYRALGASWSPHQSGNPEADWILAEANGHDYTRSFDRAIAEAEKAADGVAA